MYEEETTGNLRLPPWKSGWNRFKERVNSWLENWCADRTNTESHELKLDSSIIENCATIRKDHGAGRRSYVESSSEEYRRGANLDVSAPIISKPLSARTQDKLDSLTDHALGTETISLLMSSLAESTQGTYLKNWKMWTKFCQRRGVSPWVDTSRHNWDAEILNFLTWEYSVVKNGSSVLATRFCSIRFLHLIEGKGDFDRKAFRIRALIKAVKRKKGVQQKLPVNPEFLRGGISMLNLNRKSDSELWAAAMCGFHFALIIGGTRTVRRQGHKFL